MTGTHPAARVLTDNATPAEVAQAALDAIAADWLSFNMEFWVWSPDSVDGPWLEPGEVPSICGTKLCAAGAIAHLLGWTLYYGGLAVRDGVGNPISDVAEEALGISVKEGAQLWYCSEEEAVDQLRRIAAGGRIQVSRAD
jgi:hypothetical protein